MKRLAFSLLVSSVVFAAAAQAPIANPADATTATPAVAAQASAGDSATPATDENPTTKATRVDKGCVQQTGSRIRVRIQDGKCNGEPGSSYSREELQRTGRSDMGDALRTLDASIN